MVQILDDRNGVSDGKLDFDEFRVRRTNCRPRHPYPSTLPQAHA